MTVTYRLDLPDTSTSSWRAPEHYRLTRDMRRNRNPEKGPVGHLVVEKIPEILRRERPTRYAFP
jgi:hypothetical protein